MGQYHQLPDATDHSGGTDIGSRIIAQQLSQAWGQTVLVENKAGAAGIVGTEAVAKSAPDLPTVSEAGVPGYESISWLGLFAPAGTPKEIVEKINADVARMLNRSEVKERLLAQGAEPIGSTPQQVSATLARDIAKYAKVMKASGVQAE